MVKEEGARVGANSSPVVFAPPGVVIVGLPRFAELGPRAGELKPLGLTDLPRQRRNDSSAQGHALGF